MSNYLSIETAKAGIDAAVSERGEGYIYTEHFDTCSYVVCDLNHDSAQTDEAQALENGDAMCIVGVVLQWAGFDLEPLGELEEEGKAYLNTSRPDYLVDAEYMTVESLDLITALTRAQIEQDSGGTWGEARAAFYHALGEQVPA